MNKNFWLLGLAVAALTSCTQSEVVDIPEGQAINFDTFVDKTTRAASESEGEMNGGTLNEIYVFGDMYPYQATSAGFASATKTTLFNGTDVTKSGTSWTYPDNEKQYWQMDKSYRFAAYSNGNEELAGVTYTSNVEKDYLTFTGYEAKGKDLVAALHGDKHTNNGILKDPVTFTMSHMLARVVIEFYLDKELTESQVYLSDFIINNAYNKGNCVYTYSSDNTELNLPAWNYDGYTIVNNADSPAYSDGKQSYELTTTKKYVVFYVIPNTDFTANIPVLKFNHKSFAKNDDMSTATPIHDENMKLSLDTKVVTEKSRWLPGYSYKYILNYTAANSDETPITFSVGSVEEWKSGFGSNTLFSPEIDE